MDGYECFEFFLSIAYWYINFKVFFRLVKPSNYHCLGIGDRNETFSNVKYYHFYV